MTCLDAVIIGASCVEHISANISYCEEGPLDDRKSERVPIPSSAW